MIDQNKLAEKMGSDQKVEKGTSLLKQGLRKFRQNKMAVSSCIIIVALYMVSLSAAFFAPYSFDDGELENQNLPPTWYRALMSETFVEGMTKWAEAEVSFDLMSDVVEDVEKPEAQSFWEAPLAETEATGVNSFMNMGYFDHIMGTDEIGQDIFSRVIYGMRLSLLLALTVTIVSVFIGVSYGATSGYVGGLTDTIMMRFVDFLFGVPFIFLVILLMVFFGREIYLIFVGLGLVYWIVLARIVRGQVLSIKSMEYVLAARSNGVSEFWIVFRHLVPNVMGPVVVFSSLLVPQIMLLEAFLSFIGLGVSPPDVSLGILLSDGAAVISSFSWPMIYPGIVFSIMIFCMNFIGDGLRDAFDPKSVK